jgi:hypothetical protein
VLVPKGVDLGGGDIVKIRVNGNRPAYFELLAARGKLFAPFKRGEPDCYIQNSVMSAPEIVCPKYDWYTSRDLNRN